MIGVCCFCGQHAGNLRIHFVRNVAFFPIECHKLPSPRVVSALVCVYTLIRIHIHMLIHIELEPPLILPLHLIVKLITTHQLLHTRLDEELHNSDDTKPLLVDSFARLAENHVAEDEDLPHRFEGLVQSLPVIICQHVPLEPVFIGV